MVGTLPVILAVGATLYSKERLNALSWAALALSTTGAALIALGGRHNTAANGPSLAGDLLVVVSMGVAAFWILFNKRLMELHNHLMVTAYGLVAGTLMLALYVPFAYGPPPVHGISLKVWAALIASGLLCTAATTLLWNWGMTQVPASQAGVLLNMEPLIGSLLGVFLLSEHLGGLAWLGGAMILTAAITITTHSSAPLEDPAMI
jgi:drug/metabolite transporter (DMT)-like permease